MRQVAHTEYDGYRGVGVRLMEPMVSDLRADRAEGRDSALLEGYHRFDKAHVLMLGEEDLIPREDAITILKAFREMDAHGYAEVRANHGWGLHSGEHYLIRNLGYEIGGRIHLGRSSGDLIAVAHRIVVRERIVQTIKGILQLRRALLPVAVETADAVMPGYTHGVHAQPTTLGAQLLSWVAGLERDFERFEAAYQHTNQSPAGAAIMTGSPFAVNRDRTAACLGFDSVMSSTFDAIVGGRDYGLETFSAIAILDGHIGRWAEDIAYWYGNEARMVDIPDRFCHTSSIMMHKKNPVALEQIRGSTADVVGGLAGAFVANKGRSGGADGGGGAFFSMLASFEQVNRNMHWLSIMVPAMEVRRDRMHELASSHWAVAPDIASAIVREKGLPWRIAHQCVGTMVRFAHERGLTPRDVTPDLLDEAAIEYFSKPIGLSMGVLQAALNPTNAVNARKLYGGPAPEQTGDRAADAWQRVETDQMKVDDKERRLREAEELLEAGIDAMLAPADAKATTGA